MPPQSAVATSDRVLKAREFQLDKGERDWVDMTALAIRLRSDTNFDRSGLLRGILRAVREAGLDVESHCASEEDVATHLLEILLRGSR